MKLRRWVVSALFSSQLVWEVLSFFVSEESILLLKIKMSGAKSVVIYGANSLAARLICLLSKTDVRIAALADKQALQRSVTVQGHSAIAVLTAAEQQYLVVICVLGAEKQVIESLANEYRFVSLRYAS